MDEIIRVTVYRDNQPIECAICPICKRFATLDEVAMAEHVEQHEVYKPQVTIV